MRDNHVPTLRPPSGQDRDHVRNCRDVDGRASVVGPMAVTVGTHEAFAGHDPGPGHPEAPERFGAAQRAVQDRAAHWIEARPASLDELAEVHHEEYVRYVEHLRGRHAALDADTRVSPASVDAALYGAGLAMDVAQAVAEGHAPPGLALVRPPGHHATAERAMGFCLFNNVALAARRLQKLGLAERVAIYDWDVHHGNGTEAIFWKDDSVLYLSTHQFPFYPGTGRRQDRGGGAGDGYTVNAPMAPGDGDAQLLETSARQLEPAVRRFRPDFILASAGFDGHANDPLADLEVSTEGLRELAKRWRGLAEELCRGKIAGVLEGGYDLDALTSSIRATLDAWET